MIKKLIDRYTDINSGNVDKTEIFEMILPKTDKIISNERELKDKLLGDQKIIKFGIDPTGKDIHLGHSISMNILRYMQSMGHNIKFVIGDFTAKIGDPTGKKSERPILTDEQIISNYKTYKVQASKFLDFSKIEVINNSYIAKKITQEKLLQNFYKIGVSKVLQRNDFKDRLKKGNGLNFAEIYYPILMGFDSLEIKPDIEVGGKDQLLNLTMCREMMSNNSLTPETILTTSLLPGINNKDEKMSKSLNNYISLQDTAENIYGKIMSIPDNLILTYYKTLTDLNFEELDTLKLEIETKPYKYKKDLAFFISFVLSSIKETKEAEYKFKQHFSKKELSEESFKEIDYKGEENDILNILRNLGIIKNYNEFKDILKNGGLSIGKSVNNMNKVEENIKIEKGVLFVKKGKRGFYKISL